MWVVVLGCTLEFRLTQNTSTKGEIKKDKYLTFLLAWRILTLHSVHDSSQILSMPNGVNVWLINSIFTETIHSAVSKTPHSHRYPSEPSKETKSWDQ